MCVRTCVCTGMTNAEVDEAFLKQQLRDGYPFYEGGLLHPDSTSHVNMRTHTRDTVRTDVSGACTQASAATHRSKL